MPEGDTLYRAATRVGAALTGHTAVRVAGSHRALKPWISKLTGREIIGVENVGKHLLIHFEGGLSMRTHMQMTGVWHVYQQGESWRKSPGKARVIVETEEHVAVCFAAPDVEAGLTTELMADLERLGPDLTADDFDTAEALQRMRASNAPIAADLLLDQSVMAGVGNVFKSEILFLERINPRTPTADLAEDQLERVVARARRLLLLNRDRVRRNTTGSRGRNAGSWVYGRARKPCRRCGTSISSAELGTMPRITYWCPTCQPIK